MNQEDIQKYAIVIDNLTKTYKKKKAVDGVSMKVPYGSILGLVGKNGAGKTTLIRLLCDVAKPTSGEYALLGETDPKKLLEVRRNVAAMVETPALYLNMNAMDNLISRAILMNVQGDLKAYAREKLTFVGLQEVIDSKKHAADFSLGMRQRLGIAMALIGDPKLLILDEPTNGLDPAGIHEIRELLLRLNHEKGITILISSHILSELSKLATDYAFIDQGKIVGEVSAQQLENGSTKKFTLDVDDPAKAAKIIEKEGWSSVTENGSIVVTGYKEAADVVTALILGKVKVSHFKEEGGDLEEYFLTLLGGE